MTTLSGHDHDVLAHVVEDPAAWWAHVESAFTTGEAAQALAAKVARWQPSYQAAIERDGAEYKTRALREEN